MSTPESIVRALRGEMRSNGLTYAKLAERVGLSEPTIKRLLGGADLSLTRLASFCTAAGTTLEDVLNKSLEPATRVDRLTAEQERSLVDDTKLLLVAICCLALWSVEQIVATYRLDEPECIVRLARLDHLGLVEMKPRNRYRLNVSPTFRWLPDGPVQRYFREHVVPDYFDGRFDRPGETLLAVHGRLSAASRHQLVQQIERLGGEVFRMHRDDRRTRAPGRDGCTLIVGLRGWEFDVFTALRRT